MKVENRDSFVSAIRLVSGVMGLALLVPGIPIRSPLDLVSVILGSLSILFCIGLQRRGYFGERTGRKCSMEFTRAQAVALVEAFGGDEETVFTVTNATDGHSGPGLYASISDYSEEGSTFLGQNA